MNNTKQFVKSVLTFGAISLIVKKILAPKARNTKRISNMGSVGEPKLKMEDLIMNIHNSGELYNKLIRICHPDKFSDIHRQQIATEIFQEVSKNRRNYKVLAELEQRLKDELNIATN